MTAGISFFFTRARNWDGVMRAGSELFENRADNGLRHVRTQALQGSFAFIGILSWVRADGIGLVEFEAGLADHNLAGAIDEPELNPDDDITGGSAARGVVVK